MTFAERVRLAGNAEKAAPITEEDLLVTLKRELHALISVDELARYAQDNPERARNEVRSACRRVFEGVGWAHVGDPMRQRLVAQVIDAIFGFGVLEDLIARLL